MQQSIKYFCTLSLLFLASVAGAQDLHFSQFFNSPITTNPANTGFIPDGDYRIGASFRDQWSSVMTVPYRTVSLQGDVQLGKARFENGWLGAGGAILHDQAGTGALTSTKVYGAIAYHQLLGNASLLSLGFNIGYANKSINTSKLKFPDQFDGKFFDNTLPTSVALNRNNVGYFDLQVGMNYAYFPTENVYLNAGFSVHHVNRGRETFFEETNATFDNRIPHRYIGFLNGSFKLNDQWIVNPNAYVSVQAGSREIVAGMNAAYNLSGDGEYQLVGGAYYRLGDAAIPMVGLSWKGITATVSYDATVSSLRNFNGSRGAYELSIVKQGLFDVFNGNRKATMCPTFRNY